MKIQILSDNVRKKSFRHAGAASVLLVAAAAAVACGASRKQHAEKPQAVDRSAEWDHFAEGGPLKQEAEPSSVPLPPSSPSGSRRPGQSRRSEEKSTAWGAEAEMAAEEDGWDEVGGAPQPELPQAVAEFNTESYDSIVENRFTSAQLSPLSTFSVDVDTASYSNVRRFLSQGSRPPQGAVRIEELVNYFDYQYESPRGDAPFGVYTELSTAPWAGQHKLLHIGIQGRRILAKELPPRNLVFLLDVSGSMDEPNKLPLLKRSMAALLETMGEKDTVSIVVYAGASGMVLPPTSASQKGRIYSALERLQAGGSTNGGQGIDLAYQAAQQNFKRGGVNRVILATDGDFNVGTTNQSDLVRLIEQKRQSGVFLTVLGFGMGNYKDSTLEKLADKGNGNYAYIDSFSEARKVLVEEGGANMVTIAQDVKIQVEMNPKYVGAYRLIGYENRALRAEDFNDDTKDAGEIGAGHTVTALYEILTPEQATRQVNVDDLRYQKNQVRDDDGWGRGASNGELATVKLRYKAPQGRRSRLIEVPVRARVLSPGQTSDAFRFSAAVASFGLLLRDSEFKGRASYEQVQHLAQNSLGRDPHGHRHEFVNLVSQASRL